MKKVIRKLIDFMVWVIITVFTGTVISLIKKENLQIEYSIMLYSVIVFFYLLFVYAIWLQEKPKKVDIKDVISKGAIAEMEDVKQMFVRIARDLDYIKKCTKNNN